MDSLGAFQAAIDAQRQPARTSKAGAVPRLLSVTECLPFTGDRNSPAMIAACQRGTIVHLITERHDRGEEFDIEGTYAGYFNAWLSFLSDTRAKMLEIELRVGGDAVGYVGTLDRVAIIGKSTWVLDIKTGRPWPTQAVQTAAYEHAYRALRGIKPTAKIKRACVHLSRDGGYTMSDHTDPHDYSVFLAYRRVALFEIAAGLREQPTGRY